MRSSIHDAMSSYTCSCAHFVVNLVAHARIYLAIDLLHAGIAQQLGRSLHALAHVANRVAVAGNVQQRQVLGHLAAHSGVTTSAVKSSRVA